VTEYKDGCGKLAAFFIWQLLAAPFIRAETCREYNGYIIKYFVNCCEKEGIIIYSLVSHNCYCLEHNMPKCFINCSIY
jgi:hypothetical protein